jgi:hypothetical protein
MLPRPPICAPAGKEARCPLKRCLRDGQYLWSSHESDTSSEDAVFPQRCLSNAGHLDSPVGGHRPFTAFVAS